MTKELEKTVFTAKPAKETAFYKAVRLLIISKYGFKNCYEKMCAICEIFDISKRENKNWENQCNGFQNQTSVEKSYELSKKRDTRILDLLSYLQSLGCNIVEFQLSNNRFVQKMEIDGINYDELQ